MKKTIKIGGKEIPLTKKGLPNRVFLSGVAREIVKKYEEKQLKEKKEILEKEILELLKNLK